jgi:transcriptional regulator with XRE-family HTH domain
MSDAAILEVPRASPVGGLQKQWRGLRHMSQLDLALAAESSARHLSFVETGRARPSREMVLRLAEALDLPLRERNGLLTAAGYATVYRERTLTDASMSQVRKALDLMLGQHEPYPAVVVSRHYDLVMANQGTALLMAALGMGARGGGPLNLLRALFDPAQLRPVVVNWEEVARALVERSRRDAAAAGGDAAMAALTEELLAYPGVPEAWRAAPDIEAELPPVLSVVFAVGDSRLAWFSTIATFGTPQDVTLQELHIECFFPADPETDAWAKAQAGQYQMALGATAKAIWLARLRARAYARKACVASERPTVIFNGRWYRAAPCPHRPLNTGARFSRKAVVPSVRSSLSARSRKERDSRRSASSASRSSDLSTTCLANCWARGARLASTSA